MTFDRIYSDANEKYVKNTVIYITNSYDVGSKSHYGYKDKACTIRISKEEMRELFIKGVLVQKVNGLTLQSPCYFGVNLNDDTNADGTNTEFGYMLIHTDTLGNELTEPEHLVVYSSEYIF